MSKKKLTVTQIDTLLETLKTRFHKNMKRHEELKWEDVLKRLNSNSEKLYSLYIMEETEGEPDVIIFDKKSSEYTFVDCAAESPKGRRSICYDQVALNLRKENKPANSAMNMAMEMGVEILTEEEYRKLQTLGSFDLKTSSWVKTPDYIRALGGAIFCDNRFKTIFTYHNGAESYYAGRAFRGKLIV